MRAIIILVGLAFSAVSVGIVLSQIDLAGTMTVLSGIQVPAVTFALGALILQFIALTVRWRMLLSVAADGQPVPYRPVVEAMLVGILANAALPARLGEVARTIVVSRRGAIDLAGSAGTVILERILDVTVLCGVAVVAAVAAGAPWFLSWPLAAVFIGGSTVIVVSITGAIPVALRRLVRHIPGIAHRPRIKASIKWIGRLIDGLADHHPRVMGSALLLTIVSVLLDGVIFWAIGLSLGFELSWAQSLVLGTAGVLVTGIPSAPANVGTFELAVAAVGASLGVPTQDGLAIALVAHGLIVIPLSAAGAVVLVMSMRAMRKSKGDDEPLAGTYQAP